MLRFVPLVVALALVIGCRKKAPATPAPNADPTPSAPVAGQAPSASGATPTPLDPGPPRTLKIRSEQQGDRLSATMRGTGWIEVTATGAAPVRASGDESADYTETVLERPAGAARPTKLTRAYKTVTGFDGASGRVVTRPYQGRTVAVEKRGREYAFTVDGNPIDPANAHDLHMEFNKQDFALQDLMPRSAVKVGDKWKVEPAAVAAMLSEQPYGFDMPKSTMTGTLTRVYTQGGRLRGTIALDFDLVMMPKNPSLPKGYQSGSYKLNVTVDAVIDGSAVDQTVTESLKMDQTTKAPGLNMRTTAAFTRTKTLKSLD